MLLSRRLTRLPGGGHLSVRCAATGTSTSPSKASPAPPPPAPAVSGSGGYKFDNSRFGKNLVLIEGVRTPFSQSLTEYESLLPYQLQTYALTSLLKRLPLSAEQIDYVICGTNIHEPQTPNVAREAVLGAGWPMSIPANTVTMACVSANQAVTSAMTYINSGMYDVIVAGGVETASDVPVRHSRKLRKLLLELNKAKDTKSRLKLLTRLRPDFLTPELPALAEYFTGEVMGHSSDRISASFGVSRREQDEFGLRSHTLADQAFKAGHLSDIEPIFVPGKGLITRDNGVRVSDLGKLSTLKPAFIKEYGTATGGNSSYFTDGATACLVTSEEKAKELGLKPKAYLRQHLFVAQDLTDQLLLGPAYAISKFLTRLNLKVSDIDVWELHEAFAGQVLANLKALDSEYFCVNHLGVKGAIGSVPLEKLNAWGGSLSIGHPFGATGVRLVTTAANRLIKEDKRLALVSACAGGGIGVAMLVERYP